MVGSMGIHILRSLFVRSFVCVVLGCSSRARFVFASLLVRHQSSLASSVDARPCAVEFVSSCVCVCRC